MDEKLTTKLSNRQHFSAVEVYKDSQITDLESDLITNPAQLAYYSAQAAYWSAELDRCKYAMDNAWAKAYLEAKAVGGTGRTVEVLKAEAETNIEHQEAIGKYLKAKENLKGFEGAVASLSQKQYSLGSLNSREKREQEITSAPISRSTAEEKAERRARFTGE
jgi:hypothetical protein